LYSDSAPRCTGVPLVPRLRGHGLRCFAHLDDLENALARI
jgi:hypothetical protein